MECWLIAIKEYLKTGKWHLHSYSEFYADSYYHFKEGYITHRYSRKCTRCGKVDHFYYY